MPDEDPDPSGRKAAKTSTGDAPSKTSEIPPTPTPTRAGDRHRQPPSAPAAARGSAAAPARSCHRRPANIYSDPSGAVPCCRLCGASISHPRRPGKGGGTMDWAAPALTTFVADTSYRHLCCYAAGIAGNVFAFVLFISPLPTFKRIVRNGSTEQFSAMPYIYSLLNCLICMWYGLPFVSYGVVLIATVNSIGAVFQLAYTAVFIAFADARERLKVSALLAAVFVVFGLIVFVSLALLDHTTRQMFIGYLSVASLISMFASPLSIMNLVIRTKSVEYMPFYLSLSMFLMSASFFGYGMLLRDFFIYIPNGIGTILGIIQLVLYAYFRKGSREEARLPLLVTHT